MMANFSDIYVYINPSCSSYRMYASWQCEDVCANYFSFFHKPKVRNVYNVFSLDNCKITPAHIQPWFKVH